MTRPETPWLDLFTAPLAQAAPDVGDLIERQAHDNAASINLVASESYCPRSTLEAEASVLVNKNASG